MIEENSNLISRPETKQMAATHVGFNFDHMQHCPLCEKGFKGENGLDFEV